MTMRSNQGCTAVLMTAVLSCSIPEQTEASAAADERPTPADPSPANQEPVRGGSWLRGDVDERFALVAQQLRGFDVAMMEVGYRYTELYWAGQDRNWEYATYQLGKIETAVANGVQRRPKRAPSARMLEGAVANIRESIDAGDATAFDGAFAALTMTCNACHQAEQVPFMRVVEPTRRLSPIQGEAGSVDGDVQ